MGQIVSLAAKPKRCNLNKLSQLDTPAAGEHILVSSDNSMNAAGQGNFDCYIVGDGQKAASTLELHSISDEEITRGSRNSVSGNAVYKSMRMEVSVPIKSFVSGYYLAASVVGRAATKSSSANCSISEPIAVQKGDVVYCTHQGTGIACICTTDANGTNYVAKAISSNSTGTVTSSYTVEEDGYIAVSSRTAALSAWYITLGEKYLSLENVANKVEDDNNNPVSSKGVYRAIHGSDVSLETLEDFSEWNTGNYITNTGSLASSSNWAMKTYELGVGRNIVVKSYGSAISFISKLSNGIYTPLASSVSGYSQRGNYEYTTLEEGVYVICVRISDSTPPYLKISGDAGVMGASNINYDDKENAIGATNVQDALYNLANSQTELRTGRKKIEKEIVWNSGYIQKITGKVANSQGFIFSQPILLRAGETVEVITKGNVCTIAKATNNAVSVGDTLEILVQSFFNDIETTSVFTAEENTYISLCVKADNYKVSFYEKSDKLWLTVKKPAKKEGKYISTSLTLETNSDTSYTEPFYLRAGDVVNVKGCGYGLIYLASTDEGGTYYTAVIEDSRDSNTGYWYAYTAQEDGYFACSGRSSDFDVVIYAMRELSSIVSESNSDSGDSPTGISSLYKKWDYVRKTIAQNSAFRFMFISDIHLSWDRFKRVVKLSNELGDDVDAILNGGDNGWYVSPTVDHAVVTGYENVRVLSQKDVLMALGNHEQAIPYDSSITKTEALQLCYQQYVAPVVSDYTGIVQPSNAAADGKCYYYKDYNDVRCIVLDGSPTVGIWGADEKTWLENVLDDANQNSKTVIILQHEQCNTNVGTINTSFSKSRLLADGDPMSQEVVDVVGSFITAGGKFACFLHGHGHTDHFGYYTNIGIRMFRTDGMYVSSEPRWNDEYVHDSGIDITNEAINYMGIDTMRSRIYLLRLGRNVNGDLSEKNVLTYDYANNMVLANY